MPSSHYGNSVTSTTGYAEMLWTAVLLAAFAGSNGRGLEYLSREEPVVGAIYLVAGVSLIVWMTVSGIKSSNYKVARTICSITFALGSLGLVIAFHGPLIYLIIIAGAVFYWMRLRGFESKFQN